VAGIEKRNYIIEYFIGVSSDIGFVLNKLVHYNLTWNHITPMTKGKGCDYVYKLIILLEILMSHHTEESMDFPTKLRIDGNLRSKKK